MATYDNPHSRRVAWLKVLLPLLALAILSTLFLVSSRRDDARRLPYSEVELDRIVQDQRIGNPNYAGVTGDGAAVTLAAASATPDADDANRVAAEDIIGAVEMPDGARADLRAAGGLIDTGASEVEMTGGVALSSSTGWRVTSDAMTARLDETRVISPGPVGAEGPAGTLRAGAMDLTLVRDRYLLRFTDGVKLVYDPEPQTGDAQ